MHLSSISYNLYPPSYIPPSIQTNFVFPYSVPPTIPWTDTICDFQNSCKKSQNVTSKIAVKSHKMWLVIRYKRSMLSDCIQCWSQLTAHCCCSKRIACSPSPPTVVISAEFDMFITGSISKEVVIPLHFLETEQFVGKLRTSGSLADYCCMPGVLCFNFEQHFAGNGHEHFFDASLACHDRFHKHFKLMVDKYLYE